MPFCMQTVTGVTNCQTSRLLGSRGRAGGTQPPAQLLAAAQLQLREPCRTALLTRQPRRRTGCPHGHSLLTSENERQARHHNKPEPLKCGSLQQHSGLVCEASILWGSADLVHHFGVPSALSCCAEWTPENQSRLVQLLASEELDITLEEGQRRFQQLCQTLPDIGEHTNGLGHPPAANREDAAGCLHVSQAAAHVLLSIFQPSELMCGWVLPWTTSGMLLWLSSPLSFQHVA